MYLLVYHAFSATPVNLLKGMAGTTGLEPAASAVTGQRSNQLNYVPTVFHAVGGKPARLLTFLTSIAAPAVICRPTAASRKPEHLSMLCE